MLSADLGGARRGAVVDEPPRLVVGPAAAHFSVISGATFQVRSSIRRAPVSSNRGARRARNMASTTGAAYDSERSRPKRFDGA